MDPASTLRWLCVGTGDIVRKRAAAALAGAPGGSLSGVCGGLQRARDIAAEHGAAEVYDDLDRALESTAANAVYIGTPVDRHCHEALRAIEAGKHVLVEKPLGLNASDALRIVEAAESAGVTAGCAYYRRTFPRYAHLKKLIDSGELGRIVLVRTVCWSWFNPGPDDPKHWRVEKARSGGGPLSDMGSHMLDLITGLLGTPETVFARCATLVQDYEVEDSASVVMTLPGGTQATASFGWNSKTWAHEFEVVGSEAKVLWRPADAGDITVTRGRDIETLALPGHENVHLPLIADFNAAVAERRKPVCPAREALQTDRILDAIRQSSETDQTVMISSG